MWLADGSLDRALAEAQYAQLNAVIEPGESAKTTLLRTYSTESPWCMTDIDYWVITSNTDDVTDFQRPIDPATVAVQEHLVDRCWDGPNDDYSIE